MTGSSTLRTTWTEQATWSTVADRLKREIVLARAVILSLIVATGILECSAAQLAHCLGKEATWPRVFAIVGAVLAALAATLQMRHRSRERLKQWTRARSASEGLKEQVYRYMTRTGSYTGDADGALRTEQSRILGNVADLQFLAASSQAKAKDLPGVTDLASYVVIRVTGQIDGYYLVQAAANARRAIAWQRTQAVLLYLSAALGALAGIYAAAGLGAWVAVITTVAGAFGAHIEGARYDHLAVSYRITASRLRSLRDEWNDTLAKKALSHQESSMFVDRCEQAISVENEAWMAGWVKEK